MASCIFVFGIVHLFLKWFLHNFSFFFLFLVYYYGLQNCLCKSTTHNMAICMYRYLLRVCNGVACTNSRHFAFGVSIVMMYGLSSEIAIVNRSWLFICYSSWQSILNCICLKFACLLIRISKMIQSLEKTFYKN